MNNYIYTHTHTASQARISYIIFGNSSRLGNRVGGPNLISRDYSISTHLNFHLI